MLFVLLHGIYHFGNIYIQYKIYKESFTKNQIILFKIIIIIIIIILIIIIFLFLILFYINYNIFIIPIMVEYDYDKSNNYINNYNIFYIKW